MSRLASSLSGAYLRARSLLRLGKMSAEAQERYPVDDLITRARLGADAVYPSQILEAFGTAMLGAEIFEKRGVRRFPTLDQVLLVPPGFTPLRLEKMVELGREPLYLDVDLSCTIGGFRSTMPLVVSSMGSTDVANRPGPAIGAAAGKAGIIMGLGENIVTTRGYDKRRTHQPSFKDRLLSYLDNAPEEGGGILIQQSVEDANDELWNRVYADPDLTPHFEAGRVGFEVKLGQGAKAGLGGEVRLTREKALELAEKFHFSEDPREVVREKYERHSAPGTFTPDILRSQIRLVKNNYPKAKVWVKTGAYRDLPDQVNVAADGGADAVVVDGKEGGTGMSPSTALKDLGLPLVGAIARVRAGDKSGIDVVYSGGLRSGGDLVKAVALGGSAVSFGRPFVVAAQSNGEEGVSRFIESVRIEAAMLTSALGKYNVLDLAPEDLCAVDGPLAAALGIATLGG